MPNEEQREAWNGISGEVWTERQDQFDGMLAPWSAALAEVAAIGVGETVLDIGCGCGATTLDAARRCGPTGTAVGVDLSAPMIDRARDRADAVSLANALFEVGDCQVHDLSARTYDVTISRFGVMFFDDAVAAFANVGKATAPGGRLAVLTWAPLLLQSWLTVPAAAALQYVPMPELGQEGGPGMFSLSEEARIVEVFEAAGWVDVAVQPHQLQARVAGGGAIDEAVDFLLATGPGRAVMESARELGVVHEVVAAVRASLADHMTPQGVELDATALAVTATRP